MSKSASIYSNNTNSEAGFVEVVGKRLRFTPTNETAPQISWDEYSIVCFIRDQDLIIESTTNPTETISVKDLDFSRVLKKELGLEITTPTIKWWRGRTNLLAVIISVSFVIVMWLGLMVLRTQTKWLATFISEEDEIKLGAEAFDLVYKSKVIPLSTFSNAFYELTSSLTSLPSLKRKPWKIYVINEDEANAYALPGYYIFFTKKFILEATTPEEIVGVLSHELAHTMARHQIQELSAERTKTIVVALFLGDAPSMLAAGADSLSALSFSRKFESEADGLGLGYLKEARISAKGISAFFKRGLTKKESGSAPDWLSTHPAHQKRIDVFERDIKGEGKTRALRFPLKEFQQYLELRP